MTENRTSSTIAVGAVDVEVENPDEGRLEISTVTHRFVISADHEELKSLHGVITEIVPKLNRSVPVNEQLTSVETQRLLPYLKQLGSMGVLLFPTNSIETVEELRLYSFICRRTGTPDDILASVRARRVALRGSDIVTERLAAALAAQGLVVAPAEPDAELTIAVSLGDEDLLRGMNQRLCRQNGRWLPVLFTPKRVRIGPWVVPGDSACYRCFTEHAYSCLESGRDPGAASWLTLQAGCLGWISGLVTHMVLRAFVPMGGEHPWGRVTTIDAGSCEQTSLRAWRNPYCEDCAEQAPVAQEWIEV